MMNTKRSLLLRPQSYRHGHARPCQGACIKREETHRLPYLRMGERKQPLFFLRVHSIPSCILFSGKPVLARSCAPRTKHIRERSGKNQHHAYLTRRRTSGFFCRVCPPPNLPRPGSKKKKKNPRRVKEKKKFNSK